MSADLVKHFLRYGTHAESRYFLESELVDNYEGVVFNGNMVAMTRSAIAGFITSLKNKPFIVDPQTHAFQHDVFYVGQEGDDGTVVPKRSIQKLAEAFGDPVASKVGKSSVLPEDFANAKIRADFCKHVVQFQLGIRDQIEKRPEWSYVSYAIEKKKIDEDVLSPAGVVPPYFYMTENTLDEWLNLNCEFVKIAAAEFDDQQILAQLVISKQVVLNRSLRKKIIDAYSSLNCAAILIWIDDFDETKVGEDLLKGFRDLAHGLSSSKKVINLYGGYFSILLTKMNMLHGVSHGLEYGESRAVIPVGGGIPMAKYYFYPLHIRLRYPDFVRIIKLKGLIGKESVFKANVCECDVCEGGKIEKFGVTKPVKFKRGEQVITLNYPTPETKDFSLRHYLWSKKKEFETVASRNKTTLASELEASFDAHKSVMGLDPIYYLKNWKKLLT